MVDVTNRVPNSNNVESLTEEGKKILREAFENLLESGNGYIAIFDGGERGFYSYFAEGCAGCTVSAMAVQAHLYAAKFPHFDMDCEVTKLNKKMSKRIIKNIKKGAK